MQILAYGCRNDILSSSNTTEAISYSFIVVKATTAHSTEDHQSTEYHNSCRNDCQRFTRIAKVPLADDFQSADPRSSGGLSPKQFVSSKIEFTGI